MQTRFDAHVDEVLNTVRWADGMTPDEIAAERETMRQRVVADLERTMPSGVVRRWKLETIDA